MEPFSALLAICAGNSPVSGEFPTQRPVTRSFDVYIDLRLNKRLRKQWWGWWFETLLCPLWRHSNGWNSNQTTINFIQINACQNVIRKIRPFYSCLKVLTLTYPHLSGLWEFNGYTLDISVFSSSHINNSHPHDTLVNTLRRRQNGRHFSDDSRKYIFLNENAWIPDLNSTEVCF